MNMGSEIIYGDEVDEIEKMGGGFSSMDAEKVSQ